MVQKTHQYDALEILLFMSLYSIIFNLQKYIV